MGQKQLETAILWATGRYVLPHTRLWHMSKAEQKLNSLRWSRLLRRGLANGQDEFEGVLRLYTSSEDHNAVFQAWISACRKARTKSEETGDAKKTKECADEEQRVLRRAAELIGASAAECVPADPMRVQQQICLLLVCFEAFGRLYE